MGLRFRKSVKLAPGVKINLSKKGVGMSFGGKGCRYSIGASGRRTTTFSVPGTGLSYSTSSGKKRRKTSSTKRRSGTTKNNTSKTDYQKVIEQQNNLNEVTAFESRLNEIKSLHVTCEQSIDWNNIHNSPEPFTKNSTGPNEQQAITNLNNFKPTLLEKIFMNNGAKRKEQLEAQIPIARNEDNELYESWEESVVFSGKIIDGNIDAYYEVIEESNPFDTLVDWGSGFEFGTDDPSYMEVEFMVKSKDVIPTKSKTLTKTGKLSEKDMTKTAYYDYTQDYVCSCSIRITRELFSILPINKVLVHATDMILDTTTGMEKEETILSVIFERDLFQNINFDRIDASDFTETFKHNMKFRKTSGFLPVERLSI